MKPSFYSVQISETTEGINQLQLMSLEPNSDERIIMNSHVLQKERNDERFVV
jgi:hypothetical protein